MGGASDVLVQHAAWNLLLNRRAEYEKNCRAAAARFAGSTPPLELYEVARAAALTNQPVVETRKLADMASRAAQANPAPRWQHVLGLCLLRDGQTEAAIERCDQSLGQTWSGAPLSWLGLAIAHATTERDDEAQAWLSKAQTWLKENPLEPTSKLPPTERIECQVLLREAEQLLGNPGK